MFFKILRRVVSQPTALIEEMLPTSFQDSSPARMFVQRHIRHFVFEVRMSKPSPNQCLIPKIKTLKEAFDKVNNTPAIEPELSFEEVKRTINS